VTSGRAGYQDELKLGRMVSILEKDLLIKPARGCDHSCALRNIITLKAITWVPESRLPIHRSPPGTSGTNFATG